MLYPANTPVRDIPIQPSLIVPAGWSVGTALTPIGGGAYPLPSPGSTTHFAVTNVEQLEDSPILTGQYFQEFAVAPEISPKHYVDVASDAPEYSKISPALQAGIANLVREADALYRSHHYNDYHFLVALSDVIGSDVTLEHGQSSEYGVPEKFFSDEGYLLAGADLLPHEFSHSWNGKYRRPVGLYQPDFATAQQGALLWVYEGMTQYLGNILAARAGLKSQSQYRDILAASAANLDYTPGREWRSTEDTAIAASVLRGGNQAWSNWRRGQDYYDEGQLVWLDADTLIRKLTNNQKSLDDFQHIFLGKGGNTGPLIVTYTFDELVQDLNAVAPYDWATFLREQIVKITPHADLAGIERGGYKLVYADKPNASVAAVQSALRQAFLEPFRRSTPGSRLVSSLVATATFKMSAGTAPLPRQNLLRVTRSSLSTGRFSLAIGFELRFATRRANPSLFTSRFSRIRFFPPPTSIITMANAIPLWSASRERPHIWTTSQGPWHRLDQRNPNQRRTISERLPE